MARRHVLADTIFFAALTGAGFVLAGPAVLFPPAPAPSSLLVAGLFSGGWFARRVRRIHARGSGTRIPLALWNGALTAMGGILAARVLDDLRILGQEGLYRILYFRWDATPLAPRLEWFARQAGGHLIEALVMIPVGLVVAPAVGFLWRRLPGGERRAGRGVPAILIVAVAIVWMSLEGWTVLERERAWVARGRERVRIPEGRFLMGSSRGLPDEGPEHMVDLEAFEIDRHETTIREYWTFLDATGRERPPGWNDADRPFTLRPHEPVEAVTWDEAAACAAFAGRSLPTEAQWERAARGTAGRLFPWGDRFDRARLNGGRTLCKMENPGHMDHREPDERTGCYGAPGNHPVPVGSHPSDVSPDGVHDMAGNVAEWVLDVHEAGAYRLHASGPGPHRVYRGGDYGGAHEGTARATRRFHAPPDVRLWGKGFRTARPLPPGGFPGAGR